MLGHSWWQDHALIVSMHHQHDAYASGGETPTALPYKFLAVVLIQVLYFEHLGEVLSQIVRGSRLNSSAVSRDKGFHR
jgi:hypothetical protein